MGTLVMELDLVEDQAFRFQVVDLVKNVFGANMSSAYNNKKKTY